MRVNRTGTTYHYVAWNEIPGKVDVGTYTGNGADNRNITGVGFQPDFVMVQTNSDRPHGADGGALDGDGALDRHLALLQRDRKPDQPDSTAPAGRFPGRHRTSESNGNGAIFTYAAWGRAAPTAVRMAGMSARRTEDGVVIEWRTGYEVDNLGFHVYRGRQQRPCPPHHQSTRRLRLAGVARHRDGRRPHLPVDRRHGRRRCPRCRVPGWRRSISPARARGTARSDRMQGLDSDRAAAPGTARRSPHARGADRWPFGGRGARADRRGGHRAGTRGGIRPTVDPLAAHAVALTPSSLVGASSRVASAAPTAALQRQWSIAARAAVKIDIASAGWYRVAQPTLVAAGLATPADPRLLQLVCRRRRTAAARQRRRGRTIRSAGLGGVLRDRRRHAVHRDPHLLDSFRRLRRVAAFRWSTAGQPVTSGRRPSPSASS